MSTSIAAYITREEIKDLVIGLLGVTPNDRDEPVEIDATTYNGEEENPVSVHRAYLVAAEESGKDDFDPDDWSELFQTEYDHETGETTVHTLEVYEPDEDRRVAREIVQALTERFGL